MDCPDSYFPCYKDCCQRHDSFCNHRQERCQLCQSVEELCGNATIVPRDCDAYCIKKQYVIGCSDLVSRSYWYATIALSVIVMALIGLLILMCYKARKQRQTHYQKTASDPSSDGEEKLSLSTSTGTPKDSESVCGEGPNETPAPGLIGITERLPPPPEPSGHSSTAVLENGPGPVLTSPEGELPPVLQTSGPSDLPYGTQHHQPICRDPRLSNIQPTTSESAAALLHTSYSDGDNSSNCNY